MGLVPEPTWQDIRPLGFESIGEGFPLFHGEDLLALSEETQIVLRERLRLVYYSESVCDM